MTPKPANMQTPEFLRYDAMVNGQGLGKPSLLQHPLHAEFVALCTDTKSLLTAAVEVSLQIDGSVASVAYAVRVKLFGKIMMKRCNRIARTLISKGKEQ